MKGPVRTIRALAYPIYRVRFARYIVASIVALAVDVGGFLVLLGAGLWPAFASAISYSAGIATHWFFSSRTVFSDTVALRGIDRTRQKGLFVLSAFLGLALTTLVVGAGDLAGLDPRLAKGVAVAASFLLTWVLRSRIVFR